MSHTVHIRVDFKDRKRLESAVKALGGRWLGKGTHRLYGGSYTGDGFTLPNWQYPLVFRDDGQMAYDDFNGAWGDVKDLDRLRAAYALDTAQKAAETQGWQTEFVGENLVIYHPEGGTLTVAPGGTVDATGFQGKGCLDSILALGLPVESAQAKPEFSAVAAQVQQHPR